MVLKIHYIVQLYFLNNLCTVTVTYYFENECLMNQ